MRVGYIGQLVKTGGWGDVLLRRIQREAFTPGSNPAGVGLPLFFCVWIFSVWFSIPDISDSCYVIDEMISKYAGSFPKDAINLESNTQYLNSVDDDENGARTARLPVTPPESDLDPNLQSLSPHFLQLNSHVQLLWSKRSFPMLFVNLFTRTGFSQRAGPYEIIYGKQRAVRTRFGEESVSVALALDRASIPKW